jgi:hypothetical protein
MTIPEDLHQTPTSRATQESQLGSVKAVAECPWLRGCVGTYEERAANYVRDRAKLLEALRPGSPERLLFVAAFPASYDETLEPRPKSAPPAPNAETSDAIH